MPSSFLICYPDVPASALTYSTDSLYTGVDNNIESSFYGPRHNYTKIQFTASPMSITFDLGSGNARTIDHLILGGVQILRANPITSVLVQGSNDASTWVNQLGTSASFSTRTLNGPDVADLIFTSTYNDDLGGTLASYRYFRLRIARSTGSSILSFSKLYFGQSLDMGMEPATYDMAVTTERDSDTWKYHRGHTLMTKAFHPRHRFTVEWDEVSDAKATEFQTKILNNPYRDHVWLYADTFSDPLYNNKLVYCKVVDSECTCDKQAKDWNTIKAVFEENI